MTGELVIKVCGLTDGENIRAVERLGVEYTGFIFYAPSPRCARTLPSYLPEQHCRVGVFVDAAYQEIEHRCQEWGLGTVQLHGTEPLELCRRLKASGLKVIKAFDIGPEEARLTQRTSPYASVCDFFLFDTHTKGYGGSGRSFDWSILDQYQGPVPFLLSGGIGPHSVPDIRRIRHPFFAGIDLNSRFESAPGMKDISLLRTFLAELRKH